MADGPEQRRSVHSQGASGRGSDRCVEGAAGADQVRRGVGGGIAHANIIEFCRAGLASWVARQPAAEEQPGRLHSNRGRLGPGEPAPKRTKTFVMDKNQMSNKWFLVNFSPTVLKEFSFIYLFWCTVLNIQGALKDF